MTSSKIATYVVHCKPLDTNLALWRIDLSLSSKPGACANAHVRMCACLGTIACNISTRLIRLYDAISDYVEVANDIILTSVSCKTREGVIGLQFVNASFALATSPF